MPARNNTTYPFRPRLPSFLKQRIPTGVRFKNVTGIIEDLRLNTVCQEAQCPNRPHCFSRGAMTIQILGAICTRSCGFCAEQFGKPLTPDPLEAERVAEAAVRLGLKHIVITSPARDDLNDQGAGAFAEVINKLKERRPESTVEVLTPDFQGDVRLLQIVFDSRPHVFNHNVETVRRLTPKVRSKATYERSLFVLSEARKAGLATKSGLMVGHGETREELKETFGDLIRAGCTLLTLGQYLPPSPHHLPLQKICTPEEFDNLREEALQCGFDDVSAGPLVRSSYHAEELIAPNK